MKKAQLFSNQRKQFLFSLPLFFLINILCLSNTITAQTATVATDKSDYSPGQNVIVTGSNWQPGETVKLTFTETPLIHPPQDLFATADGAGKIYNAEYLIENHDVGQTFVLTATGISSNLTATATFTDGPYNAIEFRQAENKNHPTNPISWTGANLGTSNSEYY